jgi:hypothetical protein
MSLAGCSPEREPFPMQKVAWENSWGGNGNVNMISHVEPDPEHPEARRYWTGGTSAGKNPMSTWPRKQIDRVQHRNVAVRVFAFADAEPVATGGFANVAQTVSAAVSIWPGSDTSVEIDLHLVPAEVSYQFARLISWQEGMPFRLTLFISRNALDDSRSAGETAAHELFHVMTGILGRGAAPAAPEDNPHLLNMTNEVFAEIYAACGNLLANGKRELAVRKNSLAVDGVKYEGHLTGAQIRHFFDHHGESRVIGTAGPMMAASAFHELYGDETLVRAQSPAGNNMLELCARVAPDHSQLADWLQTIDP